MNATQSRSSSLEMEREKREAAQVATEANGEPKKVVVGIDNTDQPKCVGLIWGCSTRDARAADAAPALNQDAARHLQVHLQLVSQEQVLEGGDLAPAQDGHDDRHVWRVCLLPQVPRLDQRMSSRLAARASRVCRMLTSSTPPDQQRLRLGHARGPQDRQGESPAPSAPPRQSADHTCAPPTNRPPTITPVSPRLHSSSSLTSHR
jgi:hypothetical protein